MTDTMALTESLEDYLEAIYLIIREKKAVRAKDIAQRLSVSNASVTGALRALAKRKFLNYSPYDVITFTPEGEKVAREVARRHEVLRDFLVKVLAVEYQQADEAACKLEHGISPDIINRFVQFVEFIEICPLGGEKLIDGFRRHMKCGAGKGKCDVCLDIVREHIDSDSEGPEAVKKNSLAFLKEGEKTVIRKIRAKGALRKRLLEMGLTPGAMVEVERIAPMGDPVEVKVRGYHISLRRDEVQKVEVDMK
ncbi:MAG TPA: metal-dependent transcriptional regulator [Thermodesulfobacteriaceae bacterium]|nr:metal-dependent transcriptional regulator [Thermodesulfobacteriaceae bacterium]